MRSTLVLSICVATAVFAATIAHALPVPVEATDSLLVEARRAHYDGNEDRAIPVFRSYLASHPSDRSVRLDLANALAWSGDPERAIPYYEELLREQPEDPKLLRAHADCLRWTGRTEESLDAYRRLPDPPEEPDVRRELDRLRRSIDPAGGLESTLFHDSGEVDAERYVGASRLLGGAAGYVAASVSTERLRQSLAEGTVRTPWGTTVAARAGRSLGAAKSIRLDAGAIGYDGGPTHPRVGVRLRWPITQRLPLEVRASYRDRAFDLKSLQAYEDRIMGFESSAATYASLGYAGGVYARVRGGRYSDDNPFGSVDLSADAAIRWGLRAALAGSGIEHAHESTSYYAGRHEWSAAGHLIFDRSIAGSVHVRLDGWYGRIGNTHGDGDTRGGRGELSLPLAGTFWLRLEGEAARSRQTTAYESRLFTLGVDWRP